MNIKLKKIIAIQSNENPVAPYHKQAKILGYLTTGRSLYGFGPRWTLITYEQKIKKAGRITDPELVRQVFELAIQKKFPFPLLSSEASAKIQLDILKEIAPNVREKRHLLTIMSIMLERCKELAPYRKTPRGRDLNELLECKETIKRSINLFIQHTHITDRNSQIQLLHRILPKKHIDYASIGAGSGDYLLDLLKPVIEDLTNPFVLINLVGILRYLWQKDKDCMWNFIFDQSNLRDPDCAIKVLNEIFCNPQFIASPQHESSLELCFDREIYGPLSEFQLKDLRLDFESVFLNRLSSKFWVFFLDLQIKKEWPERNWWSFYEHNRSSFYKTFQDPNELNSLVDYLNALEVDTAHNFEKAIRIYSLIISRMNGVPHFYKLELETYISKLKNGHFLSPSGIHDGLKHLPDQIVIGSCDITRHWVALCWDNCRYAREPQSGVSYSSLVDFADTPQKQDWILDYLGEMLNLRVSPEHFEGWFKFANGILSYSTPQLLNFIPRFTECISKFLSVNCHNAYNVSAIFELLPKLWNVPLGPKKLELLDPLIQSVVDHKFRDVAGSKVRDQIIALEITPDALKLRYYRALTQTYGKLISSCSVWSEPSIFDLGQLLFQINEDKSAIPPKRLKQLERLSNWHFYWKKSKIIIENGVQEGKQPSAISHYIDELQNIVEVDSGKERIISEQEILFYRCLVENAHSIELPRSPLNRLNNAFTQSLSDCTAEQNNILLLYLNYWFEYKSNSHEMENDPIRECIDTPQKQESMINLLKSLPIHEGKNIKVLEGVFHSTLTIGDISLIEFRKKIGEYLEFSSRDFQPEIQRLWKTLCVRDGKDPFEEAVKTKAFADAISKASHNMEDREHVCKLFSDFPFYLYPETTGWRCLAYPAKVLTDSPGYRIAYLNATSAIEDIVHEQKALEYKNAPENFSYRDGPNFDDFCSRIAEEDYISGYAKYVGNRSREQLQMEYNYFYPTKTIVYNHGIKLTISKLGVGATSKQIESNIKKLRSGIPSLAQIQPTKEILLSMISPYPR